MKLRVITFLLAALFGGSAVASIVEYTIDPAASVLTLTGDFAGAPFSSQTPGSDAAGFSGTFSADREPTTLVLQTSHPASLFQSTSQLPGRFDGDSDTSFGLKAQSPTLGSILFSTTRLQFYISTDYRPPLDVADGTFDTLDVGFFLADGAFYYSADGIGRSYGDLHGYGGLTRFSEVGTIAVANGIETLTIPINTTFDVSIPNGDVTLSFNGQFVANRPIPEPSVALIGFTASAFLALRRGRCGT